MTNAAGDEAVVSKGIISGRVLSARLIEKICRETARFIEETERRPGLATVLGVIQMAKRLNVPLAPTFAVLALIMMPRFYGHSFINSKDIPFTCAFTWLQVILCSRLEYPKLSWRSIFLIGLGYGLVFATRPGSLLLVLLLTLLTVGYMGLMADSPLHSWRKAHGTRQRKPLKSLQT